MSVAIAVPCVTALLLCGIAGCIYLHRRDRHHKQLQKRAAALSQEISEVFHSGMHENSNGGTMSLRQDSIPVQYMNASGKLRSPVLTSPVITSGTTTSCTTSGTTPAASIKRNPSWPAHKSEQLEYMNQFNSTPAHNGAMPCGLALPSTSSSPATTNTPSIQYGEHQKQVLISLKENKILRSQSLNQRDREGPKEAGPESHPLPPLRLSPDLATPSTSTALDAQASEAVTAPTGTPPQSPFAQSIEIDLGDIDALLQGSSPESPREAGLELPPESPTTESAGPTQLLTSSASPTVSRLPPAPAHEYANNYSLSSELQLGDLKDDDDEQADAVPDTKTSASRSIKRMVKADLDEDFRI